MIIFVATTNPGKIREISKILEMPGISILTPEDINISLDVEENGQSFAENAVIKARAWCEASGYPCLADDSGLVVKALDGRPGVRSARFAGNDATDEENYTLLLDSLKEVKDRRACFVCELALAFPDGDVVLARGEYEGLILEEPTGDAGFGYDPVFLDPASGRSFAQLSPQEKNDRSHRKKALIELKQKLLESGRL
ncbi:MAG TPA: RdgB/HAM1 family non-canonical purine NTP pyrophosphatase [Deltaproteobacteria bacterium]|nr:RdgB/HAM1 family non-canonical purine NTP pyrophosphatase [Deltaproteobacteria bacterium]